MKILLAIAMLLCLPIRAEVYVYGTNLQLTGSGFGIYSGTDAPFPSYLGQINAGTQYVDVTMSVNVDTVGPHKFFLYFLDFDYPDFISLPGYSTNSIKVSYRNTYSGRWSGGLSFTNVAPLTSITMRWDRTNSLSSIAKLLISGLFITTNMVSTVDRDGYLLDWTYPTTMDTNTPNKGNLVHDSSFEGRGNEGWGISKQSRTNYFLATYNTTAAYHGATSLQLPNDTTATYVSRLYKVAANKQHTVSVYARALTGTAVAEVGFQNVKTPPSGLGFSNRQWAAISQTVTTNWTRISTNFYALKYPEAEFRVTLRALSGGADALFDAVQVEEGTLDTYAPQSNFEFGLTTDTTGNIFTNADSAAININCFNYGPTSETQTISWRITDNMHRILRAGVTNYTLASSARGTIVIPHGLSRAGWFCFDAWVNGLQGSGDELQYAINLDTSSLVDFGGHVEATFLRNPQILARLGAQWTRGLSVFQAGRWAVAEPTTPGTFVWSDTEVARYQTAGLRLMQNLGENVPAWAVRQYFTTTNGSGSFTLGETITAGTNTAQVAWILTAANYTGTALQLSNVVGSFTSNDTVTGSSSGATAKVYCTPVVQTPDLYRWGLFVSNWVSHYGTNIQSLEIWNEPNQDTEIPKPNGSMAFYAEILRIAVNMIKAISPTTEIVAMGGVLTAADVISTFNYLDAPTLAKIDRISLHYYDPNAAGAWAAYTNLLAYGKPIDNTESGFYDKGSYVGVNSPRKTEGYPVSLWNDLEWRVATAVEQPRTAARNVMQTKAGGLDRFFYYDFRYSGHMPETSGQGAQPSAMDYDDTVIAKGVAASALLRMIRGYTGAGPVTTKNTNVWGLLWSGTNGSAAMVWATNNTGYQLVLTNGYSSSKVLDIFGTALATGQSTVSVVRLPRFIFSGSTLAVLSNAVATAAINAVADTEPPVARITICPTGQLPFNDREVIIKWMGTDQQSMPNEGFPDLLRFQWRLVGLETNWTTPVAQVFTVYDNLPIGQYTFQLRAVDAAGNVSPFDSRAFSIGTNYNGKPKAVGNTPTGSLLILNN